MIVGTDDVLRVACEEVLRVVGTRPRQAERARDEFSGSLRLLQVVEMTFQFLDLV